MRKLDRARNRGLQKSWIVPTDDAAALRTEAGERGDLGVAHRPNRGSIGAQPEPSGDRRKLPFRIVEHVLRPHAQDSLRRQPCEEAHNALVHVKPRGDAGHRLAPERMRRHGAPAVLDHRDLRRYRVAGEVQVARVRVGAGEAAQRRRGGDILGRLLDRRARSEPGEQHVEDMCARPA